MFVVTIRNRWLLIATVLVLIVAIALATIWLPRRAAALRDSMARDAATGVVAAAARGDSAELESRFGRPVSPSTKARLAVLVPAGLGADPKRYQALFVNPLSPERLTVEVHNPSDATFAALVSMTWDEGSDQWRAIEVERVVAK